MTKTNRFEGVRVSRRQAFRELANQGFTSPSDIVRFFTELGDCESYSAPEFVAWIRS